MKVQDIRIPDDLLYTEEHEWLRISDGLVRVGITDYAQKSLHEIVFVDVPAQGSRFKRREPMSTAESVKAVSEVFCPVSGQVVEANEALVLNPELVNQDPYDRGWIALIKPDDLNGERRTLMTPKEYGEYITKLLQK